MATGSLAQCESVASNETMRLSNHQWIDLLHHQQLHSIYLGFRKGARGHLCTQMPGFQHCIRFTSVFTVHPQPNITDSTQIHFGLMSQLLKKECIWSPLCSRKVAIHGCDALTGQWNSPWLCICVCACGTIWLNRVGPVELTELWQWTWNIVRAGLGSPFSQFGSIANELTSWTDVKGMRIVLV